ncbi:MAG: Gfo/Idh/MocA family oxidoreductase [Actinobacteria bacterium]|nr:Gfo/Idh/MocA family oxidoreductase [Actinomycetota bacterium]
MTERVLRIGVIGGGAIVRQRHMPGLQAIPGVEVAAVCNRHRASAEKFAADYQIRTIYDDWRELIADSTLDVVWIGTTPYMHAPLAIAALEAGRHVFTQARMARNLAEARAMVAAAARHPDKVAAICPPPVGMAGDLTMRRLLRRERFAGTVRQVRLSVLAGSLAGAGDALHWRQDFDISGINTLTVGIYAEVLHRWVGAAASLQARTDTYVRVRRHPESGEYVEVRVPDSVSVVGQLAQGADFVYQWSGVAHLGPPNELWVFGDAGTLTYNFGSDTIRGAKATDAELREIAIPAQERGSWQVEADYIRAVRQGGATGLAPSFAEGLKYMEFLEALMCSAREGRAVALPLDA